MTACMPPYHCLLFTLSVLFSFVLHSVYFIYGDMVMPNNVSANREVYMSLLTISKHTHLLRYRH